MSDTFHSDSLSSEEGVGINYEASYTELDTQSCASSFFGVIFPYELSLPTKHGVEVRNSVITIVHKG